MSKFGGITESEIKSARPTFFSLNYQKAVFMSGEKEYPAVRGIFLGIGTQIFEWEGKNIKKLVVFLGNGEGGIIQVEVGFYTWTAYQILNLMASANGSLKDRVVMFSLSKTPEKKTSLFMQLDGAYLKYKYKFGDMKFPEGKDAREKHLEKVICKWYENLLSLYEFKAVTVPVEDDVLEADIPF